MRSCPNCGHIFRVTNALKGQLRKGRAQWQCRKCGTWYSIEPDDIDITVFDAAAEKRRIAKIKNNRMASEARKVGLDYETYRQRITFGLCLGCGEPAKNSARYCDQCKGKKVQK